MIFKNKSNLVAYEPEELAKQLNQFKVEGDTAYRAKLFLKATHFYTLALSINHRNAIILSNRSAAHLSNDETFRAVSDAHKCIAILPNFLKSNSRLATATLALGRYNESIYLFQKKLKLNGIHEFAKNRLKVCQRCLICRFKRNKELLYMASDCIDIHSHILPTRNQATRLNKRINTNNFAGFDFNEKYINISTDERPCDKINNAELLSDFFNDVDHEISCNKIKSFENSQHSIDKSIFIKKFPEKSIKFIKQQRLSLGTKAYQVNRIICSNNKWYNLNPFRVLDIPLYESTEALSYRQKALCLLLHPDKSYSGLKNILEEAFEYIQIATTLFQNPNKILYTRNLITEGMIRGLKDYNTSMVERKKLGLAKLPTSSHEEKIVLDQYHQKAILKIFAEMEDKRIDVEKRRWCFKQRERVKEDGERKKTLKEREFEKHWRSESRVERRVGNWKKFQILKKNELRHRTHEQTQEK